MNIIIPLGGKGERFSKNGYTQPKPLIRIFEKCMIEYVLDNLSFSKDDKIFIIYNSKLEKYDFSKTIHNKYPMIQLIEIDDTKGAVETIFMGIDYIMKNYRYNNRSLILDCDTFYTENIIDIFRSSNNNMVFYTKNYELNPIYSYIELNNDSIILNIKEKEKISDNANTGAYAFNDITILYNFCKYVLDNNITFNNEPYTSCVISEMIKSNTLFEGYELKSHNVFSLGTPESVEKYINSTYAFLFDLDGTLVITDSIYYEVWYEILKNYNIILTEEIFTKFIQGNNDKYVVNTLLKNIDVTLSEISLLKDELFMKNIHKIKIIDGVYELIDKIKSLAFKLCIVTNCNRTVANAIVNYIKIDKKIDFIISSDDCVNGKPNPEPYSKAIENYNINNEKCFIFEDSKSGLLSGRGVNPKLLIGIETIYNDIELINYGVNYSIKDFCDFNIENVISFNQNNVKYFENIIKNNSNISNIKNVYIDEQKLKGGFIADVISFKIITRDNNIHSQILKYENTKKNNLSIMAEKLRLYEREYYFYTNISNHININFPKFYNLIYDKDENIGIVLENLFDKNYKVNLNLNSESIDVTMKIIDNMSKMHSKFWNKNLNILFPNLKNSNDSIFNPFFANFINDKYELFKNRWFKILNKQQIAECDEIVRNFQIIQDRFSNGNNLTFIHGDIKSPNIFYDIKNNYEPYFIDWQHCAIGKGVQDLIFFVIESFEITNIILIFNIAKNYYYKKILEYGIRDYSFEEYERDIYDAICYIPFFTSIWFGTISQDELIDKNFPYFLITKMFHLIDYVKT
jgi:hypothetical protein